MVSQPSPFHASGEGVLTEHDFSAWLASFSPNDEAITTTMSSHISALDRRLRYGEAAALLRAINRLEPIQLGSQEPTATYLIGGKHPTEELLLTYAISSALKLKPILHLVPSLRASKSMVAGMASMLDTLHIAQPGIRLDLSTNTWLRVHDSFSIRSHLFEALSLYMHLDPIWDAIALLMCVPQGKTEHVVYADIKVSRSSDEPLRVSVGLSLPTAIEFASNLMKIAWLANLRCRAILTDAALTTPLTFGAPAEIEDFLQALDGRRKTPPVVAAIAASAHTLAAVSSTSFADAELQARTVLDDGRACAAAESWNVPNINALRDFVSALGWRGVHASSSGYFAGIDYPRVDAALAEAVSQQNARHTFGAGIAVSALVLPLVGQFVRAGEDLLQASGTRDEAGTHFVEDLIKACILDSRNPPQEWSPVRAHIVAESVLVRRMVAVVLPIIRDSGGALSNLYVQDLGEGSNLNLLSDRFTFGASRDIRTMADLAQQIARLAFGEGTLIQINEIGNTRGSEPVYDPHEDKLLPLHYHVYSAEVASEFVSDLFGTDGQGDAGRWVTVAELEDALPSREHTLTTCWPLIRGILHL